MQHQPYHGQGNKILQQFCAFFTILVAFSAILIAYGGIHQIKEGHLGVYYRGGALIPGVSMPGYHVLIPFLTTFKQVHFSIQTDKVKNIACGTSGGVLVYFESIEVVNQLRKEMIHHEINQFCSNYTLSQIYIEVFEKLDEFLLETLQKDCNI